MGLLAQVGVYDLLENVEGLSADQRLPVDGKGGRALHADLPGDLRHLLNGLGVFAGVHTLVEGLGIQTHILSKRFQVVLAEGALILAVLVGEQVIVVFPELILVGGTLAGFGSPERFLA